MGIKRLLRSQRKYSNDEFDPDLDQHIQRTPYAQKAHQDDESNWLVSYADMMTLLCGFFIMLFSISKIDEPKFEKVKESVAKSFGGKYVPQTDDAARFLTHLLFETGLEKEATITTDSSGVSIVFQSTAFFDTLSSELRTEGKTILNRLIDGVMTREKIEKKKFKVVVEGHTDNRPVLGGIYPSNWELSSARAARVVRLFLEKGFRAEHLTAIGYADTRPVLPSRTLASAPAVNPPDAPTAAPSAPAAPVAANEAPVGPPALPSHQEELELARNRRVVVRILDSRSEAIPFPAVSAH